MSGLFKTPKVPKPQPTVTPQDAAITSMDEALRLRKRRGRLSNMFMFGRRRGQLGTGTAAGILGTSPGGGGGSPGGGGSGGGGGFDAGGGGGGGGGGGLVF